MNFKPTRFNPQDKVTVCVCVLRSMYLLKKHKYKRAISSAPLQTQAKVGSAVCYNVVRSTK